MIIADETELADSVAPLSLEEAKWVRRLERVLRAQPSRLLVVECADGLMIVDRDHAHSTEMHDGGATRAGIVLADLEEVTFCVTSVSG